MALPVPINRWSNGPSRRITEANPGCSDRHAEAVLSAYALLQQLHDTGTLDVLRGALGAGDVLVEHVVSLVTAPESITALRNVILIGKVLGSINPEVFTPCSKEFPRLTGQRQARNRPRFSPSGGGSLRMTRAAAWQPQ